MEDFYDGSISIMKYISISKFNLIRYSASTLKVILWRSFNWSHL